ncbi:hypothetical protein ACGFIY_20980 [Micromonospora chersina]|uniref:hypothetical protein n=1 Tax=Micromonospora chersina TaxID=47854 RepID=UPI0037191251
MDEPQMPPIQLDQLRGAIKTFGRELFAYCLNINESEVEAIEGDLNRASSGIMPVLVDMVKNLTQIKLHLAITDTPLEFSISSIHLLEENGRKLSIFNLWRTQSGGDMPGFSTGDRVMDALASALTDVYPVTIVFRHLANSPWHFTYTPDLAPSIDLMRSFGEAVLADPYLARLFPNPTDDKLDHSFYFVSNTGRAGSLQLAVFSSAVFRAAYSMFRFRQQTSAVDLRDAVTSTLAILRSLAEGKVVSVPAWIGVGNIALPVDKVRLPWGTLRPYPEPTQVELIPSNARPSITVDADGKSWTLGAILETSFLSQLIVEPPRSEMAGVTWPSSMAREFAKLDEQFFDTSLAAMLATEGTPLAGCRRLWTAIFDPLSFGSYLSFKTDANPPVSAHILTDGEVESMQEWGETLRSKPVKSIEIPQRRILSAVAERVDPVDGFIDAIIAWEALFAGTDQGELSFRICAAMATLLHDSQTARLDEHKRLVKLYNKRSKVLHGAQEITQSDAIESRDYAVRVALDCIKKLFLNHPEMLQDSDRSKKIILGL